MDEIRSGYAVIAQMLGIDVDVLRAASMRWEADPELEPISIPAFAERLADLKATADQLNNTNLWEHAIRESMDAVDIPLTLPTAGMPRFVLHEGGKREEK